MHENLILRKGYPTVLVWIAFLCFLILLMVMIGGITRLTGSGLSIVEWQPIMGAIPPLSEAQWMEAFSQYQKYPQYQLVNSGMSLSGFKLIFFWEYIHRLLGRFIGVAFLLPWLYFIWSRKIDKRLAMRLFGGFILGGLQGALGWFMVKSGLTDEPQVSHLRLASHLMLAVVTLSYLFWILLDLLRNGNGFERQPRRHSSMNYAAWGLMTLIGVQLLYGAFVAGLKAGYGYNTFPLMAGHWMHPAVFAFGSGLHNLVDNPAMVQFIHRSLGWIVLLMTLAMLIRLPREKSVRTLAVFVCFQFVLGVFTLLFGVPVSLAALHQLGGCLVFLSFIWVIHSTR